MKNKTAVVFLTNIPNNGTIDFAERIAKETNFEVFIVVDNNDVHFDRRIDNVDFIQVRDSVCKDFGYVGCNIDGKSTHIQKEVIAYDKCMFHFCNVQLNDFDYFWIFEDDVFIPSIDTIINLDKKYGSYDLVTPNNFEKTNNALDWHWKHIVDKIDPPYYYSMVCAMGISNNLLTKVKEYVANNNQLFYIEVMFNTIAMQNNLSVISPLELKSIVWMGDFGINEWLLLPNNVFHPLKSVDEHEYYRTTIQKAKDIRYKPVNKLPPFITELMD